MGFDLANIETRKHAEAGKHFPVRNPTSGEPVLDENGKPVEICISGADASRIKNAVEERARSRRAALDAPAKQGEAKPDFDSWQQRESDMVDDLVLLTVGWTDNLVLDGQPFPYSPDNARTLYTRFPEIAEQMTVNATRRVNFMPVSSKK